MVLIYGSSGLSLENYPVALELREVKITVNNIIEQAIFSLCQDLLDSLSLCLLSHFNKSIISGSFELGGIALGVAHGTVHHIESPLTSSSVHPQCRKK